MRGESERVAARVRELLADYGERWDEAGGVEPAPARPVGPPGPAEPRALAEPTRWQQLRVRLPVRLDPGRSGALAVGLAVVVMAVLTGFWLLTQRPHAVPVAAGGDAGALSGAPTPVGTALPTALPTVAPGSSASSAGRLVVDVAGWVRRPGLYRLPDGARVADAIQAAGGPLRRVDLNSLNLAARVVDGQQILVGRDQPAAQPAQPAPPGAGAGPAGTPTSAPVSLNSASLDELETLPGVGPVLAQNIIDWRTANGGFASVDQLTDVSGIGDITFAQLQPLVTL